MIPPFLMTLGGKIGVGVVIVGLAIGAKLAYDSRQQSIGENRNEAKHTEQTQEQIVIVERLEDAQAVIRMEGLERMIAEKEAFNAAMLKENRQLKAKLSTATSKEPEVMYDVQFIEVDKIVEKPAPCVVPDELVDRVDYLAGVLNQIPYDRVSVDGEADRERAVQGLPPVTCTALADRIETLTSRLGNTLIGYRTLSDKAVKQWKLSEAFKKEQVQE